MTEKRKAGRPRTANHDRVRVTIKMDPDLKEWTADKKRSDMVNRLLQLYKAASDGIDHEIRRRQQGLTPILLDGEADAILNGSPVDSPFKGLVDDRITLKEANYILEQLAKGQPKPPKDKP